jgi:outer membrane scaffolding protein for murein synthesis (MipA/OmpV family)
MKRRSTTAGFASCALARLTLAVLAASYGAFAAGEELPLWEMGIGVFPSTFPAYRGSHDREYYVFPFPYLVYRGEILKADREGIRAQLFDSERVQFNISINGDIPAKSDSHSAREGMPDLDGALEIGPSLDLVIAKPAAQQTVRIRLPVRAVITTNFRRIGMEGWLFNPQINWDYGGGAAGWHAGLSLGPLFATRRYHAYYYEVVAQYATPNRPAYRASAGYSGVTGVASVSRRFAHIWVGGFMRYDYLAGAAFDDSPLVETDHALMGGVSVAWIFATSRKTVSR